MIEKVELGWPVRQGLVPISEPAQIWITNDIRDFANFWPRSTNLGASQCYAFQCADILELHCETFLPAQNADPWFVAILDKESDPLALFPLMIERKRYARILRFIDGALSDYNAPVLFPSAQQWRVEAIQTIWRQIEKKLPFDLTRLEKIPARVGEIDNPMALMTSLPQGQSGHHLSLLESWEEISARFPRRKELERKTRQLSRLGTITFDVAKTAEQYDSLIDALIRQKRRRDLEDWGSNTLDIPGLQSYLLKARRLLYPSGPVALFGLKVGDTVVAAHWGYIAGSRFSSLIPSFEGGDWYTYSPGFILARKMLEWCVNNGVRIFDYGWGDEPYKRELCNLSTALFRGEIPSTVRGRLYLALRGLNRYVAKSRQFWSRLGRAWSDCSRRVAQHRYYSRRAT